MPFDPNNMKDRVQAAIAFMDTDAMEQSVPQSPSADAAAQSNEPSLAEEVGAIASPAPAATVPSKMPLKPMKRPDASPAPSRPATSAPSVPPVAAEPAPAGSDELPGGFVVGNLVFNKNDASDPGLIMQVQGQWKHALVVRYVHPDRSHQERGDQRHHPNLLVPPVQHGFDAEMIDETTLRLKSDRKEFEVKLVGALPVVL